MPYKLPFRVVHVTSQDENFPAFELNRHSPATRGWISSRFCIYPQQVVFALEQRARLRKIQILCHQYLIASRVEFFVGDTLGEDIQHYQSARYTRLGYVSLSDNESTDFKARELKSVHVDATGTYVQLLLHKNFVNKHNLYNQVGLIAVNLIGDVLRKPSSHDPEESTTIVQRPDFIPPTEDLAFDIYQDPEVANIIRRLEKQKLSAVTQERFDQAQKIRDAIGYLQRIGERLGRLTLEKQQAIEEENYERAKLKKFQINELRTNLYHDLDLVNLLSDKESESVEVTSELGAKTKKGSNNRKVEEPDSSKNAIDNKATADNHSADSADEEDLSCPHATEKRTMTARISDPDERPLPALKHRVQVNNNNAAIESDETTHLLAPPRVVRPIGHPAVHSPPLTRIPDIDESQELRELEEVEESHATELVEEFGDDIHEDADEDPSVGELPDQPEPLSEANRRQADVAIDVVGIELVTKAFSKSWFFREKALLELEQRVTGRRLLPPASIPDLVDPDPRAELRSTAFLLRRALQDQVLSIFRLATRFIKATLVDFAERYGISRVELHYALDKLVPVLFHRTGETSVRIREVAKAQILAMAEWPQLRHSSTFWNEVVRPFSRVTLDRLALSRMELVTELYASRGVDVPGPDHGHLPASGFTLDAVATFTVKALNHRLNEVREAAENLMVALYRAENRAAIRHVMPPDDIEAQRHPLYRRLFGKFDRIDEKYAPVGLGDGGVVPDTVKKQKDLEALQAEVQQLRTIMSNDVPGRGSIAPRRVPYVPLKDRSRASNRRACLSKPTGKQSQKTVASHQPKDESHTRTSKSRERFSPLPAQSAQLVGEAELLLSLDKTCIFCGEHNDTFTEEGLDLHYWKDCPMLHRCVNCKQVVEIAGMVDHLLTECEAVPPGHYVRCQRCFEAVPKTDVSTHPCIPCVLGGRGLRCPLCHGDLPLSVSSSTLAPPSGPEDVWKAHLLGLDQNAIPICPDNPRRPIRTQQAVHLNSKDGHSPRMPTGARAQKQNGQMASMSKPLSQSSYKTKTGIPQPTHPVTHIRPM